MKLEKSYFCYLKKNDIRFNLIASRPIDKGLRIISDQNVSLAEIRTHE